MAKNVKKEKKENGILMGILLAVVGIIGIVASDKYVFMLFGIIEIPLSVVGVIFIVLGVLSIFMEIKEKRNKKDDQLKDE